MIHFSLCIVVIAVFDSVSGLSISMPSKVDIGKGILNCKEVDRQCISECGRTTCTVKDLCCKIHTTKCVSRTRNVTKCEPFQCLNGGERVPRLEKCDTIPLEPVCEVPLPVCSCPSGFTGRCCQNKTGICPVYPEFSKLPCIHGCANDSDCDGEKKCCDRFCSRVCVEPQRNDYPNICSLINCGPNKICRNVVTPGVPQLDYKCVPDDINNVCPSAPPRHVNECVKECERDSDCGSIGHPNAIAEPTTSAHFKCCQYGCASQCISTE